MMEPCFSYRVAGSLCQSKIPATQNWNATWMASVSWLKATIPDHKLTVLLHRQFPFQHQECIFGQGFDVVYAWV